LSSSVNGTDAQGRVGALAAYSQFLELRHQAGICNLTGRAAECPKLSGAEALSSW
jgi:hypothetical protein